MIVKPGMRLHSAVCDTEVVVVQARRPEVDLRCGGAAMLPAGEAAPDAAMPSDTTGTVLGKRYAHEPSGIEVLCTKAGRGGLTVGDDPIPVKSAKQLPSSD
jgi:hypothetical protein